MSISATYRQSIQALLDEAEARFESDMAKRAEDRGENRGRTPPHIPSHLAEVDLTINEEALIALCATFAKAGAFDNEQMRAALQENISATTAPLIQEWIEKNLPAIAREAVGEALGKISKVRPNAMRPAAHQPRLSKKETDALK